MTPGKQIIVAFVFGVTFVVALLVLAIKFPSPTPFQYNVFRIVLALAAAGVAAMIPGFITVNLNPMTGLLIRAGGAIAIFVIVFFFNPPSMPQEDNSRQDGPVENSAHGDYFFIVLERGPITSGSASILINNEPVGELQVKPGYEKDQLKVDLSYKGPLKYEIHGIRETVVHDQNFNETIDRGTANGQGTISPKPGETLYLKFFWFLEGGGASTRTATLEHAPTAEDIRDTLDSIVTELILNPGEEFQARDALFGHMTKNAGAMNLSENKAFDLTLSSSDDEIILYLIQKNLVSESVAAEYQARAPLGR